MRWLPEEPAARRDVLLSVVAVVLVVPLLLLLAPLVDGSGRDIRLLALVPLLAGALAPRPRVALWTGFAAAVLFLVGVWIRGPHDECDDPATEPQPEPPAAPAMTGCFDQPEVNVALFGILAAVAWAALAIGAVAGDWARQGLRRRRA